MIGFIHKSKTLPSGFLANEYKPLSSEPKNPQTNQDTSCKTYIKLIITPHIPRRMIDSLKKKLVRFSILAPNGKITNAIIGRRYLGPHPLKPCQ